MERNIYNLYWAPGFCWCGCERRVMFPGRQFVNSEHVGDLMSWLLDLYRERPLPQIAIRPFKNPQSSVVIGMGSPGVIAAWSLPLDAYIKFEARRRRKSEDHIRQRIERQILIREALASS